MKRKTVDFTWEDEDAQQVFREWIPFPNAQISSQEIDCIENFLSLAPPLDVLDVGCGNGPHSVEMAKRGYRVVAIDVAKRFLDEAKRSAQEAGVTVDFRLQHASDLTERCAFDFVLAYWHTIGFIPLEGIQKHFGAIHATLKPGCKFLYVFQGPKLIPWRDALDAAPVRNWSERDGKFMLSEKALRNGYREEYSVVIDTRAGEITEFREHQKAMFYSDVLGHLRRAGFIEIEAFKDFDRTPATSEEFSVFVCTRT